jgi:UPF0755 protein
MSFKISSISKFLVVIAFACIVFIYFTISTAPSMFPAPSTFTIRENESLRSVSARLEKEHYIRSALVFRAWVSTLGRDRAVHLGGYIFDKPVPLSTVVTKLTSGGPDVPLVSITIPEGSTSAEIAMLVHVALPEVSVQSFLAEVSKTKSNGKLFPSTYFLLPSDTHKRLISLMVKTFNAKYESEFSGVTYPATITTQSEIISLAAILEGEAKTKEDMEIVAGILIHRMKIGLALQVDAAPVTYTTRGLPNDSINNPGIIALDAALHPTDSSYLYYLTGRDGTMHYSKTFEEHKKNIQIYLR